MARPPTTMPLSHPQNRAGASVPPIEGATTESTSSGGAASVGTDETAACTPRVWPHLLLWFHAGLLRRPSPVRRWKTPRIGQRNHRERITQLLGTVAPRRTRSD